MAESLKFGKGGLDEVREVFPDISWQRTGSGKVRILDEKKGEYVPVNEGQFIVHIGDRFEVHDKEPKAAKPAEVPAPEKEETTAAPKETAKSEDEKSDDK